MQLLFICGELSLYDPFIKLKNKTLYLCGAYILSASQKKGDCDHPLDGLNLSLFAFTLSQVLCNSGKTCFLSTWKDRPSGQFRLKATAFVIYHKQKPNLYFLLS
jgi:hypothetical protein